MTHQDDSVVARGLDERAEPLTGLLIVLLPRRGDGVSWNGRRRGHDTDGTLYLAVMLARMSVRLRENRQNLSAMFTGKCAQPLHCDFLTVRKVPVRSEYIMMKFMPG